MSLNPDTNNAIIIQQAFQFKGNHTFTDMLRLTYPRHSAYALAHEFDYWHDIAPLYPEMRGGGWDKIALIGRALEKGYSFVAWVDSDAAIMDVTADLRGALPPDKSFGACLHDAKWFKEPNWGIPPHYNIGVTYWRNTEHSRAFIRDWFGLYEQFKETRWMEQGAFNHLVERYDQHFHRCEDTYNATVNVNPVKNPIVKGWHGVFPVAKRLLMMKAELRDDFIKFRV